MELWVSVLCLRASRKEELCLIQKCSDNIIAEIPYRIGWKPEWNKERFLQSLDNEIDAVLELGKAKSSLIDSLFEFARG